MIALANDDLTGAALVALMQLSFSEQGIALPDFSSNPKLNAPHASLSGKTALADAVLKTYGPEALLKVGQSVPRMAFDPIGAVLLAARDGPDLLARWARLERYVHTRHPIILREVTPNSACLDHRRYPADPPSPAIDFVLAGVIAGLLKAIGCNRLCLTVGEGHASVSAIVDGDVSFKPHEKMSATGLWQFRWTTGTNHRVVAATLFKQPNQPLTKLSRDVAALVESDLLRSWPLDALAKAVGQSTRTLQRRLAEDGLSLQAIRRAAQIRKASLMLLDGGPSFSSIGFACGFSDQAHFNRAFREVTSMSPTEFCAVAGTHRKTGQVPMQSRPRRKVVMA